MASVRIYRADDAAALTDIFVRAVRETGRHAYSDAQLDAWAKAGGALERTRERCGDGRLVLVAVDETDSPVAFIDLESDGHLDMMYCLPEWTGKGVASALYDMLESAARGRGQARLRVEASEIAKSFFLRKGFTLMRRNDFEIGGIPIHNYAMEKVLSTRSLGKPSPAV